MVGIMDILGRLGNNASLNNPSLLPQPGQEGNMSPAQMAMLQAVGGRLAFPTNQQRILQRGNANNYDIAHWSQGVADMLNTIGGRQMLAAGFEGSNQAGQIADNMAVPRPNTNPPMPQNTSRAPDPTGFSEAPNGGANTNTVVDHVADDYRYFVSQGLSENQAAALAYRRQRESGSDYHAVNPSDGGRISIGGMQWNRERALNLIRFARENNIEVPSGHISNVDNMRAAIAAIPPAIQRAFVMHELNNSESQSGTALRNARTPQDAYRAVLGFIRPANQNILTNDISNISSIISRGAQSNNSPQATATQPTVVAQNEMIPDRGNLGELTLPEGIESDVIQTQSREPYTIPPPEGPQAGRSVTNQDRPMLPGTNIPIFNPETDFVQQHPTPPPFNYGLSPQQSRALALVDETTRNRINQQLERQWQPQYTEIPNMGRRWVVPATGQSGWQPIPHYGKMQANGAEVDIVTIYDQFGRRKIYALTPNQSTPAGSPQVAPVAPGAPPAVQGTQMPPGAETAPGAPPASPPAATETSPTGEPRLPTPDGRLPPVSSAFDDPDLQRARDIAVEQEQRRILASKLGEGQAEPIVEAVRAGREALGLREIVAMINELERHPDINRVLTGPDAERFLRFQQRINGVFQLAGMSTPFSQGGVTAAEAINKLNTMLGALGARSLTNRPTQFDFQAFLKANPGLLSSPGGRRFMAYVLGQMADRDIELGRRASQMTPDNAKNWATIADDTARNYRFIYNGYVFDRLNPTMRINPQTGEPVLGIPNRGDIRGNTEGNQSFQYIGPNNNAVEAKKPENWVQVDPRNTSTWRIRRP